MRIKSLYGLLLIIAFAILPAQRASAWIETGHKIVALIAWEDLTPKTKAAVIELLKQHPRYEKDLLLDAPEGATPDELARHAFAVAASWPDMIRSQAHPMRNQFHHPFWHYIDIPFEDGKQRIEKGEQGPPPHNVVEALAQCSDELKKSSTTPDMKAVDICWVEHLVGDIHQPLHAATRYSPQFANGDAGGNNALVLRDPPYMDSQAKLHLVWDSFPGDFESEFIDRYVAAGLRNDPKFSRQQFAAKLGSQDFPGWANESHALAVEYVYLNGKLEVATAPRRGERPTTQPIPGLTNEYKKNAEKVCMQQVTLAGYRLADVLNSIFDPKR
jgi:hypothetical protein